MVDQQISRLHLEASELKASGDLINAVERLRQARALMHQSSLVYTAEQWCRLPLYMQRAGMFEEALQEFQSLIDELPTEARRWAKLDMPEVGPASQKRAFYKLLCKEHLKTYKAKRDLATSRQAKNKR